MDVQLTGHGVNSDVESQVDATHFAARVSIRPDEHQWASGGLIGGHYRIGAQTGTMAAGIASAAQVFQVRWADPAKLFILKELVVQCATLTGFAATSLGAPLELIVGHGSTASGSGGTALAPTSISNRMRQSMATTGFATAGEIRISSTAALTAATGQTLEAAAISECMGASNQTLVQTSQQWLFDQRDAGVHPLILNTGDTLVVRTLNPAATGTWVMCVSMAWMEAGVY